MGQQADIYINDTDGARVNPADKASNDGGAEVLTVPAGTKIGGSDHACVEAIVVATGAGATYMTIDADLGDAAVTDFPMIQNEQYHIKVSNVNLLRFLGVNAETINVLWRT